MKLIATSRETYNGLATMRRDALISGEFVLNDLLDQLLINCFVENPAIIPQEHIYHLLVIMSYINTIDNTRKTEGRIDYDSIRKLNKIYLCISEKINYETV